MNKAEKAALVYWRVHKARSGVKDAEALTTSQAIRVISEELNVLDPARRVTQKLFDLQHEIILGERKCTKQSAAASVSKLTPRIRV